MFDQACCLIFYGFHVWMAHSDDLIQTHGNVARVRRKKKIPVVPVSYRKKIRVGRLEIIFFLNIFFMVFSIISVTTDAILAAACNHPEKIGSHGQSH
jgi:nitrate reductase NapE component